MKTAVEWLEEELAGNLKSIILNNDFRMIEKLFEQAKEMEHEQLNIRYLNGLIVGILVGASLGWFMFT
jgi:F0F1-type ATP synthase assembly protein I